MFNAKYSDVDDEPNGQLSVHVLITFLDNFGGVIEQNFFFR